MMERFSTGSFIVGIMLGALLVGAWFVNGNAFFVPTWTPSSSPLAATSTDFTATPSNGALSVADQSAGDTVVVESVTVPPPGVWIAVREMFGNDLGNVLGAAHVGGPRSNFPVSLLRATEPDRPYAVELYRDDGSGGFDLAEDSVYIDFDTGAPVIAYFRTAP